MRAAPGRIGLAGEVDQPLRGRLRRGVSGMRSAGCGPGPSSAAYAAAGAGSAPAPSRVSIHSSMASSATSRSRSYPVADGQGRVGPVDGRLVRETACVEVRGPAGHRSPHRRAGPGFLQCLAQRGRALGQPRAEHRGIVAGAGRQVDGMLHGPGPRRPGAYRGPGPALQVADVAQQSARGPAGTGRHRHHQVRVPDDAGQQAGLPDDLVTVTVVAQPGHQLTVAARAPGTSGCAGLACRPVGRYQPSPQGDN